MFSKALLAQLMEPALSVISIISWEFSITQASRWLCSRCS